MCSAQLLSLLQLFAIPWTVAYQAPLSMDFPGNPLEWVAISYFRGSSQRSYWNCISCTGRSIGFFSTVPSGNGSKWFDAYVLGKNLVRSREKTIMLRLHLPPLSLGIIAHLIGESCINLLLQLLLDIRVSGQNIQKEGKSIASGLIASKNKDNTLGHEFLVRES